jgi:hypothetical protein
MVGGKIVSIQEEPDRIRVIVAEKPPWPSSRHETCGVNVAKTGHPLRLGDSLWWQGGHCYWTSREPGAREDVAIPKIGYSYSVGVTDR